MCGTIVFEGSADHIFLLYFRSLGLAKYGTYCDFNSHVSKQEIDYKDWALAYKNEINIEQNRLGEKDVSSIFFGGGTPSLMPPNLVESIINSIGKKWNITNKTEITVEANPSSVEINNFKYSNLQCFLFKTSIQFKR